MGRFVHHLYDQNTEGHTDYLPHSSLHLVSDALRASGGHFDSKTQAIIAFGAMFTLQKLKYARPGMSLPGFVSADDYFMAALAVAQKYIIDVSVTNGRLVDAAAGLYTITRLNVLERTLLQWLGYDVSMDVEQLVVFAQFALVDYGDVPLWILKAGVVVPVELGCWPYFGEQLLVPRVQAIPYDTYLCGCTSCIEPCDDFLAFLAQLFPSPAPSNNNRR